MNENLRGGLRRRLRSATRAATGAASLALCVLAGCDRSDPKRPPPANPLDAPPESMGTALQNVVTVPLRRDRELVENSAAAMSARQPGVLFTINDSGNDALLFAVDTTGADRGVWRVHGATNVDWEAASIGPCGAQQPQGAASACVYIGDTGENTGAPSRAIYRIVEPNATGGRGQVQAEVLHYTYPDQSHDVEAMYVAPNGDVVLITKRPIQDRARRLRPALVFRVPASAWGTSDRAVAQLVDSLPIVPGSVPFRLITDASLAPDAKHVAVRTYAQVYIFATDSVTGAVNHAIAPTVCDVTSLGEPQGEGVTWANARGRLVFTSEGRRAPLKLADCL
jgi:hypothetical protein